MMAGCTFSHQMKFDAVLFEDFYCVSPATIYRKHIDDAASSLLNKLIATLSLSSLFIDESRKIELAQRNALSSHINLFRRNVHLSILPFYLLWPSISLRLWLDMHRNHWKLVSLLFQHNQQLKITPINERTHA